jgi:hypothetical protein
VFESSLWATDRKVSRTLKKAEKRSNLRTWWMFRADHESFVTRKHDSADLAARWIALPERCELSNLAVGAPRPALGREVASPENLGCLYA